MAKVRNIRTLESIAVKIRDLAIVKAPEDTGNLKNRIRSANTPAKTKMVKVSDDLKDISISLDYAPNGAEYGQWFNEPPSPVSKRRKSLKKTAISKGNWNYAIEAMDDIDLSQQFNDFLNEIGDYIIEDIEIEFDTK